MMKIIIKDKLFQSCRLVLLFVFAWLVVWLLRTDSVAGSGSEQPSLILGVKQVDERGLHTANTHLNSSLPICQVLGDSLGFGLSIFSVADDGNWIVNTHTQQGVDWRFGYFYIKHLSHPLSSGAIWLINYRLDQAEQGGAIPVTTFYAMLDIGQENNFSGSEAEIVQQMLQDPASMHSYFDNYIDLLQLLETRATTDSPIIVQVEPDSWGFMMWAMGVNGNGDATSVPVKVSASGHPAVQGFADHAGGLGQALVHLRDQYAPHILLGWHASNFRVGTRPEVVVDFFNSMGEWDVLFSEPPHMLPSNTPWWQTWDSTLINTNLNWYQTLSTETGLPFLIWQDALGNDYHLIGSWASNKTMLTQLASVGVAGFMFEHYNHCGDSGADNFRSYCALAPGGQPSGRARDYRDRVLAYQNEPLTWPDNTPCQTFSPPTSLRVIEALESNGTLTVTLQWTAPAQAASQELRYSTAYITEENWSSTQIITSALAGNDFTYTADIPYTGAAVYFAIRAKNQSDNWSPLSNNAFWPYYDTYLPLIKQ